MEEGDGGRERQGEGKEKERPSIIYSIQEGSWS